MDSPLIRPTFLTILCVLTFLSSLSGLWSQSERLWNPGVIADQTRETFEELRTKLEEQSSEADTKMVDRMFESVIKETTAETIRTGAIIMIIFESLTLFAAYLMWNLDKKGFFLYLGAIAVALFAPLILIGGWVGVINAMAGVFFSIFMGIMYAIHLKYMH